MLRQESGHGRQDRVVVDNPCSVAGGEAPGWVRYFFPEKRNPLSGPLFRRQVRQLTEAADVKLQTLRRPPGNSTLALRQRWCLASRQQPHADHPSHAQFRLTLLTMSRSGRRQQVVHLAALRPILLVSEVIRPTRLAMQTPVLHVTPRVGGERAI